MKPKGGFHHTKPEVGEGDILSSSWKTRLQVILNYLSRSWPFTAHVDHKRNGQEEWIFVLFFFEIENLHKLRVLFVILHQTLP
jgi:hypothetical protein